MPDDSKSGREKEVNEDHKDDPPSDSDPPDSDKSDPEEDEILEKDKENTNMGFK